MTHLHFPDGVLPIWLLLMGFAITVLLLGRTLQLLKAEEHLAPKVSLIAMMAAVMLIANSIPMGFIHFHMNLTVLASLLIGPWYAFMSAFVVNVFLSFIGHGGVTVIGLNTLIFGAEIFLASLVFYLLGQRVRLSGAIFSTVIITLLLSTVLVGLVVALAALTVDPLVLGQFLEKGHQLTGGIGMWLITLILPVVAAGATVEALVSGGIVKYLKKVKPQLVAHLTDSPGEDQEKVGSKLS